MKPIIVSIIILSCLQISCNSDDWTSLFDGNSLDGWAINEYPETWSVENGAIKCNGPRSHLFYTGIGEYQDFKNFEFHAEVKTLPGSNAGIYFHTEFQDTDWPAKGYEAQILNSKPKVKPGDYVEHKLTGSLYAIRNAWKTPVKDNEWFDYKILVQGKTIRIYINNQLITDYTEPESVERPSNLKGRILSSGTFALQGHDPGSTVYFRNIKVRSLPDDLPSPGSPINDSNFEDEIVHLSNYNYPLIDSHVYLDSGLTIDDALANARKYGFTYGFSYSLGERYRFETTDAIESFLTTYEKPSGSYLALQVHGNDWQNEIPEEILSQFDYISGDAMSWIDAKGKKVDLRTLSESEIGDPQDFMDELVNQIVKKISSGSIDVLVRCTYLPEFLQDPYEVLWTEQRKDRVIRALFDNQVALEINERYQVPVPMFISRAKHRGVKFTFGSDNTGPDDLGRLEYGVKMIEECGLVDRDIWIP